MLRCENLLIEYMKNPLGLDEEKPRFSWKLKSDNSNVFQQAYRIVVDGVWDSGRVESAKSSHIEYAGEKLMPKTHYNVKAKVWDNHGEESEWMTGGFETGFLGENLWKAKWLVPEVTETVPVFAKKFEVKDDLKKARAYATAYGIYEIYINGERVSDRYLTPGFTSYKKRLQYQTYDIWEYLNPGENEIKIYVAKGWCTGRYPFQTWSNVYSLEAGVLAQIELQYRDKTEVVATDEAWNCYESKIRFSEIYDGEIYDNSFDETIPRNFKIADYGYSNIIGQINEPVRVIDSIKPKQIMKTPNGETVIDFGQNMVGWVEFKVTGNKGDKVILSHGEVLDKDGNFYNKNLRTAKQKIEYILSGEGEEIYHSRLSFQGFQYVRVDEYPGAVEAEKFVAYVLCSDMERTGYFESSHELLNQLYKNIIWGHRGNFLEIPTDCPQRDERVGWTGDIQVFCKTAAQNMNVALFMKKWLGDVRADQTEEGACLIFVPSMTEFQTAAGWGDAATVCPWEIYMAYGDKKLLEVQYESMKKWVYYIKNQGDNPYLWNTGFSFGDWLAMDSFDKRNGATSADFLATAYYALSCRIVRDAAKVLEREDDYKEFSGLYDKVIENFRLEFITPNGRVSENTQTANAMALKFDLVKDKERVAKKLNDMVTKNENKLTTGFLGTPCLCDALSENGYEEKAFDLLLQEEYPSWLFSVKMGATTVWEHWDGIRPDGTFWDDKMNSYNHYAYGAIADFMYKKIGGIIPLAPGYKKIQIKPVMDQRITFAKTSIETVYGEVKTEWKYVNDKFEMKVSVPCNTSAEIILPNSEKHEVGSGVYEYS